MVESHNISFTTYYKSGVGGGVKYKNFQFSNFQFSKNKKERRIIKVL